VDKITAVGEFLYLTEDNEDSAEDFKQALTNIREDVPKNLSRDFGSGIPACAPQADGQRAVG
jgi:hypothetical protein